MKAGRGNAQFYMAAALGAIPTTGSSSGNDRGVGGNSQRSWGDKGSMSKRFDGREDRDVKSIVQVSLPLPSLSYWRSSTFDSHMSIYPLYPKFDVKPQILILLPFFVDASGTYSSCRTCHRNGRRSVSHGRDVCSNKSTMATDSATDGRVSPSSSRTRDGILILFLDRSGVCSATPIYRAPLPRAARPAPAPRAAPVAGSTGKNIIDQQPPSKSSFQTPNLASSSSDGQKPTPAGYICYRCGQKGLLFKESSSSM